MYHSKSLTQYGCGPAKYVNFGLCIEDESPVLVRARVKNRETESMSESFVVPPAVGLGHGMCTGEFDFKDGYSYLAAKCFVAGIGIIRRKGGAGGGVRM